VNHPAPLTPVDVLRAVPAHLEAHGWCQGNDRDGVGAECLRGAISDIAAGDPNAQTGDLYRRSMLLLEVHLGDDVVAWNDATGRTLADVTAAATAAADRFDELAFTTEQLAGVADIVCVNQLQVDLATEAGITAVIDSTWTSTQQVRAFGSASVRAFGSASVRAFGSASVRASGSASVHASGSASVRASGSASVHAFGSASVRAFGSASVRAFGSASVHAFGSASVRAFGSASVHAFASASVRAFGSASVHAFDSASVRAFGSASVHASDSASVHAFGSASVRASGSASVRASGSASVRASGSASVRASGSASVQFWRWRNGGYELVAVLTAPDAPPHQTVVSDQPMRLAGDTIEAVPA
jgi:hypothetical protein